MFSNCEIVFESCGGCDELGNSSVRLLHDFERWALSDAASDGKLCADTSEERVDVTSTHAAFVDTPDCM